MVTIPTTTEILSSVGAVSSPFFNEYIIYIKFALGVLIGFMLVRWLGKIIIEGALSLFGTKEEKQKIWHTSEEWEQEAMFGKWRHNPFKK